MYLVKTITDRGHSLTLVKSVRATADAEAGRKLIERSLSPFVASLFSTAELEELAVACWRCPRCRSDRPWGPTTCSPPSQYA